MFQLILPFQLDLPFDPAPPEGAEAGAGAAPAAPGGRPARVRRPRVRSRGASGVLELGGKEATQ